MPKIVRFAQTGGPEVLELFEEPLVEPKGKEVRLKVEALGLNRAESMFRMGAYLTQPALPSRNGYEAAGVIDAVGPDVKTLKVGDRISTIPAFDLSEYGVYGESAIVPEFAAAPYPANLSALEGASIWMQYVTAWSGLIEIGKLKPRQSVIITAASSSVGLAAIQIVKTEGGVAIATTRKADKRAALLRAGADHVIVTDDENLVERVNAITANLGANLVFDPVAGPGLDSLAQAAAYHATLLVYGALDSRPTPYPLFASLAKCLTIRAFTLFEITAQPDILARAKDYVYKGLASGALKPILDPKVFTLAEIADAHRYMESNVQFGKIVVRV
jgi:NADPH:quinone reductase-like Zn-dependent oxidoreductase